MEICVLDTYTLRWKVLAPTDGFDVDACISEVPFHRYGHSAVAWNHMVLIWGGRSDSSGACNALYCYNTDDRKWTRPVTHGESPEKRDGHTAAVVADVMYIFGQSDSIQFDSRRHFSRIKMKSEFYFKLSEFFFSIISLISNLIFNIRTIRSLMNGLFFLLNKFRKNISEEKNVFCGRKQRRIFPSRWF
jgi:hypothetical protein